MVSKVKIPAYCEHYRSYDADYDLHNYYRIHIIAYYRFSSAIFRFWDVCLLSSYILTPLFLEYGH